MRLILLPGLDGSGQLFAEFIDSLAENISVTCISFSEQEQLAYPELADYVRSRLPTDEKYIILAESFSGPIACLLAQTNLKHLQAIIFVASFLKNPNRRLLWLTCLLPLTILLRFSPPDFIIRKWMLGEKAGDEMLSKFKSILRRLPVKTIKFRLQEIYNLTLAEFTIGLPVYYIKPLQDRLVMEDNYYDFEKRCSTIELFTLDGPHFILQSKAKECANYVSQCVNKTIKSI
ncbi:hypothetical protein MNBD_GAMMA21-1682 [hydrothermal vent metagenome]|uniref:Serine aminopeptidase S33 domain-containing protein n=1 Tax=hydrothermal vent metagenome TaxID=652676 RepID=A0A3B1AI65_9ZZZZ